MLKANADSALAVALEIQRRAAVAGFDWPDARGPREKITEELAELDCVLWQARGGSRRSVRNPVAGGAQAGMRNGAAGHAAQTNEELGDLLFAVVNLARHLDVDPEHALASANEKFRRRFRDIEERLAAEGLRPDEVDLTRLDALWDEAKRRESP